MRENLPQDRLEALAPIASACVSRPRILVLNQYYRPGVEATANLLADLCEALADDYDVTVVTGRLQGRDDLPHTEMLNGVRVLRTRSTSFDRTKLSQRGLNYATYLADSLDAVALGRPAASSSCA